jgi:hypothetical protein
MRGAAASGSSNPSASSSSNLHGASGRGPADSSGSGSGGMAMLVGDGATAATHEGPGALPRSLSAVAPSLLLGMANGNYGNGLAHLPPLLPPPIATGDGARPSGTPKPLAVTQPATGTRSVPRLLPAPGWLETVLTAGRGEQRGRGRTDACEQQLPLRGGRGGRCPARRCGGRSDWVCPAARRPWQQPQQHLRR